eukprot:10665613-Alexandrium_andersonii.AAC.1
MDCGAVAGTFPTHAMAFPLLWPVLLLASPKTCQTNFILKVGWFEQVFGHASSSTDHWGIEGQ